MRIKHLIVIILLTSSALAQWSTTPFTKDALFACPGFSNRIVTYPDGSSIIIGIGDNNEIWLQKLDQFGYKQWLPWVSVFPSINGWRFFLSDDDGGIYAIIGTQAQRVDKNGSLRWGENGKTIIPNGSLTKAVADGKNGFLGIHNYFDSLQRVIVFRYDNSGTKLWERQIDSSNIKGAITGDIKGILGTKTLVKTSRGKCILIDLAGETINIDSTYLYEGIFVKESDTTAFNVQSLSFTQDSLGNLSKIRVVKINSNWDTSWTFSYESRSDSVRYLNIGDPFFPDGIGNIIHISSYYDSNDSAFVRMKRISSNGFIGNSKGVVIKGLAGRYFFNLKGRVGFINDEDYLYAQSIDIIGAKLWPDSLLVLADRENTAYLTVASDNLGGAVLAFWTVAGGIKVLHTGRVGKVGILTKAPNQKIVIKDYQLFQNYPNPFNPATVIRYQLAENSAVSVKIFDLLGREAAELVNERQEAGTYSTQWNASQFLSGIYFAVMRAGSFTATKKLILMK